MILATRLILILCETFFRVDLHDKKAEYKIVANFANLPDSIESFYDDMETPQEQFNIGKLTSLFVF